MMRELLDVHRLPTAKFGRIHCIQYYAMVAGDIAPVCRLHCSPAGGFRV